MAGVGISAGREGAGRVACTAVFFSAGKYDEMLVFLFE